MKNKRFPTSWRALRPPVLESVSRSEFRHLIYTYSILLLTQAGPCLPSLLPFLPRPERLNSRRNPLWATNFPPKLILPSFLLSLSLWLTSLSITLFNPPPQPPPPLTPHPLFLQILSPFQQVPYDRFVPDGMICLSWRSSLLLFLVLDRFRFPAASSVFFLLGLLLLFISVCTDSLHVFNKLPTFFFPINDISSLYVYRQLEPVCWSLHVCRSPGKSGFTTVWRADADYR